MNDSPADSKRITIGIVIGFLYLIVSAGLYALAIFMVSILVFACVHSIPDWVYMIVFIGFPLPLVFSSIIVPILYIKRKRWQWILLTTVAGIFLSCVVFLVWFITLTQNC